MACVASTLAATELFGKHIGGVWMKYPLPEDDGLMNILRDLQYIVCSGVLEEETLMAVGRRMAFRLNFPFYHIQEVVDMKVFTFLLHNLYCQLHGEAAKEQTYYTKILHLTNMVMQLEHTPPKPLPTTLFLLDN